MVRLYVKHCPIYCSGRRQPMEKHLQERGFTDVIWFTKYSKYHLFNQFVHEKFDKCISIEGLSGLIKLYECLLLFLDDETAGDHAIFCDDDIVFIEGSKDIIDTLPPYPFINLSIGVSFSILPNHSIYENNTFNNGGSEVVRISREFAKFIVSNFDLRMGMDHVYTGMLLYNNLKLYMCPIAQQTSILVRCEQSTYRTIGKGEIENFIFNFRPTGINYLDMWNESEMPHEDNMEFYKQIVEDDFYKRYGQKLDIQNWNYILNRSSLILSETVSNNGLSQI